MVVQRKERRERVIETVVAAFLETGKPVNSQYVSKESGLGLKPASIRSIMKELEDEGYLQQPHTSAGRVPTVKCYRYYVRYLMPSVDLTGGELESLRSAIENGMREHDAELFLHHMASVLSELTDLIGVALSPTLDRSLFDRLEIVGIGGSGYLLVLSLESGFVNTIRITLDSVVPNRRIEETARLLTERLHGLTVGEIKNSVIQRLEHMSNGDRRLVEIILRNSDRIFSFFGNHNIHVAGLSRALARPEFSVADHSLKLVNLFEEKHEIVNALRLSLADETDVSIHIGGRGPWGTSPPLSIVSAIYSTGAAEGAIGVIGPARIHYPKLSALVRYAAGHTSLFFSTS